MVAEASGSYAARGPLEWLYVLFRFSCFAPHACKKMHGNEDLFKRMHTCVHSITTTVPVRVQKVSALSHDLKANNVQSKINDVLCV